MTGAKLLRFAAVLIVLAAYVFVFRTAETRIADRLDQNTRIAERTRAGERALLSLPGLERRRAHLREGLRAIDLNAARSALVARFLRDAARIAAAHRATIAAITAGGAQSATAVAAPREQADPLEALPLEITVEGRYADVLATMRALSTARALAAVDVASLARKHADGADATLIATLHVVLERSAPPHATPTGPDDVRAGRG